MGSSGDFILQAEVRLRPVALSSSRVSGPQRVYRRRARRNSEGWVEEKIRASMMTHDDDSRNRNHDTNNNDDDGKKS